jgi:DNA-binding SARP family transcriptional activator
MRYAMHADADLSGPSFGMRSEIMGGAPVSRAEVEAPDFAPKARIQIFALGRFSIAIGGEALRSGGKARHRPLGLLKALISLGGRDVASSRLCECLWPDSDGDLGARNLSITLHRLRTMLQTNSAVLSDNGNVSLNENVCWVDAWDFERLANDGLGRFGACPDAASGEIPLREALRLYVGDFLARESEEPWMLASRLRLKSKFERLVLALCTRFELHNRYSDSIDISLQALELDPLNEMFYRRAMQGYLKRGEIADVLRLYSRCRNTLMKLLAAPVSGETERLYAEALHATHGASAQTAHRTSGWRSD